MLRSASNPRAAEILGAGYRTARRQPVAAQLTGTAAGERSELLLSVIAGIWLMRKVIATPALAAAEPGALTAQLEELFGLLTAEIRPNR